VKNIEFYVDFCKWSNLWSDRFFVLVLRKRMCGKVNRLHIFASENRFFEPLENVPTKPDCMIPKRRACEDAPYQLRHASTYQTQKSNGLSKQFPMIIPNLNGFVKRQSEKRMDTRRLYTGRRPRCAEGCTRSVTPAP
jgi:hypothetical protein